MVNHREDTLAVFVAFAHTTNYVSHAGAIPFLWSEESGELKAKQTWKILTFLKQSILVLQIVFMLYQLFYYFIQTKDTPVFQKIHVLYTTLGISTVGYNTNVVYGDPAAIEAVVNNLVRMIRRFYDSQMDRATAVKSSNSVIRGVRLLVFTFTFITLTYSLRIIRDPGNNRYLTSLLSNPKNSSPALRAAVGLFHMTAIGFEFFTLTFTFSLVFVCIVVDMMVRLRCSAPVVSLPSKVALSRICKHAGEVSVLTQHFNSIYGTFMLTLEILIVISIVVNTTFAVVHASSRALIIASTLFIIIIYAYQTYGTLYEESRVTWESWKRAGRSSAWFRRYCRAYRPARILMGSFFYADKSLTLTMFSVILNYTANMALTARKN